MFQFKKQMKQIAVLIPFRYVVLCMRIMTRMGTDVLNELKKDDANFVRCIHSVGQPLPVKSNTLTNVFDFLS